MGDSSFVRPLVDTGHNKLYDQCGVRSCYISVGAFHDNE